MIRKIAWALCCMMMICGVAYATEDTVINPSVDDVELSVLYVSLAGNATTGFVWTYAISDEDTLVLESEEYLPDDADENMAGVGGTTLFTFESTLNGAGMVTLTFLYAQPWEGGSVELEYEVDVWVDEAGLLSVQSTRRTFPMWIVGEAVACPECGSEEAVIDEVIDGGDEEGGVVYFLTIECPTCGTVEDMAF